jgi:DNA-binding MarR family transcriptional regulator
MKLSPSQLAVLRILASRDEPLAYFKGGFWTIPSIMKEVAEHGYSNRRWVTMGTVKSMEKKGLLAQTGSSTNYDIRFYPALSDRILTEKGLALAQ